MNHNQWQTNTTKIISNTKSQYMHIHRHKHTRRHIQGLQPGPAGHEHTNTSWPTWPLRQGARVPDLRCSGSEPKVLERLCLCNMHFNRDGYGKSMHQLIQWGTISTKPKVKWMYWFRRETYRKPMVFINKFIEVSFTCSLWPNLNQYCELNKFWQIIRSSSSLSQPCTCLKSSIFCAGLCPGWMVGARATSHGHAATQQSSWSPPWKTRCRDSDRSSPRTGLACT
jgi:hypothetical protein